MRTLQDKIRYRHVWDAVLFKQFREQPENPAVIRVERLLSLLVEAQTLWDESREYWEAVHRAEPLPTTRMQKESGGAHFDVVQQLNTALKRYSWRSVIGTGKDGMSELITSAKGTVSVWESSTVRSLLALTTTRGALSRFRRCGECRQWFYATASHQRFCGETCRKRHASQSPDFKEKRRIYMREQYRPQQKELEQRSLAKARKLQPKQSKG